MVQQLRALAALMKNLDLILSTHMTHSDSVSGDLIPSSGSPREQGIHGLHKHTFQPNSHHIKTKKSIYIYMLSFTNLLPSLFLGQKLDKQISLPLNL